MPVDRLTELQFRLALLDAALTGKDWRTVVHAAGHASIETFLNGDHRYYLSDGGYSRVTVYPLDETYTLVLASESRTAVAERWDGCESLRKFVEEELHRLLRADGWME